MAKYRLAISIPTYERPECISELVDHIINEAEKLNIGIYIFDGSISDETKKVCEKYKDFTCFNYIRQTGEIKERHWEAVTAPDCDYLLLNRDRCIIKSEFLGIILRLLEENLDLYIICDCTFRLPHRMCFINSPCELLKDYVCILTLFGSYVLKKDILKATDNNIDAKYYKSFALLAKILKSIPNLKNFRALFIPFDYKTNYFYVNKEYLMNSKYFFDTWGDDWIKMINDLPSCYDEYKYEAKQSRYLESFLVFDLRRWGTIDLKSVLKNSNLIKQMTSIPLIFFILLALIPKILIKPLFKIIKPIYELYDFIRIKINKNIHIMKNKLKNQK